MSAPRGLSAGDVRAILGLLDGAPGDLDVTVAGVRVVAERRRAGPAAGSGARDAAPLPAPHAPAGGSLAPRASAEGGPQARAPEPRPAAVVVAAPRAGRLALSPDLRPGEPLAAGALLGQVGEGARALPVEAPAAGEVAVLAADGAFVEHGQALAVLRPAG